MVSYLKNLIKIKREKKIGDRLGCQIVSRSNVLRHHFYLPKIIIHVQTGLEYSEGYFHV